MLPWTEYGSGFPALVMMPFLGGSQREWTEVFQLLSHSFRCVTLDLPGFGAAGDQSGYSVDQMCDAVVEALRSLGVGSYALVGHSMAGKVSAVTARRLLDGTATMHPPMALCLVAPSPPSPEPMSESKRNEMLAFFSGGVNRGDAEKYIEQNLSVEIPETLFKRTVDEAMSINHHAWTAWLESGSKEDWSDYVGVMDLPTLIVAGNDDGALGPQAQRDLTLPHFTNGKLEVLPCSHLIPLEQPEKLASLISKFIQAIDKVEAYQQLVKSPRVSRQTRQVLLKRAEPDDPGYEPAAMTREELHTLRSVLARVVPQSGPVTIDLAARLDRQLASGKGDGWRYAVLPPDSEACVAGLALLNQLAQKLNGAPFAELSELAKDSLLDAVAAGRIGSPKLDLKRWFEDLRANAVAIYVSHPNTLAAMGYSGIADDPNGFVQIGIGKAEDWERLVR